MSYLMQMPCQFGWEKCSIKAVNVCCIDRNISFIELSCSQTFKLHSTVMPYIGLNQTIMRFMIYCFLTAVQCVNGHHQLYPFMRLAQPQPCPLSAVSQHNIWSHHMLNIIFQNLINFLLIVRLYLFLQVYTFTVFSLKFGKEHGLPLN